MCNGLFFTLCVFFCGDGETHFWDKRLGLHPPTCTSDMTVHASGILCLWTDTARKERQPFFFPTSDCFNWRKVSQFQNFGWSGTCNSSLQCSSRVRIDPPNKHQNHDTFDSLFNEIQLNDIIIILKMDKNRLWFFLTASVKMKNNEKV